MWGLLRELSSWRKRPTRRMHGHRIVLGGRQDLLLRLNWVM